MSCVKCCSFLSSGKAVLRGNSRNKCTDVNMGKKGLVVTTKKNSGQATLFLGGTLRQVI